VVADPAPTGQASSLSARFSGVPGSVAGPGWFSDRRGDGVVNAAVVFAAQGSGAVAQVRSVWGTTNGDVDRHVEVELFELGRDRAGQILCVRA